MIISCNKCNKKFNVKDDLIPESGRLLKCGSCLFEWFYKPNLNLEQLELKENKPKLYEEKESLTNSEEKIKKEDTNEIKVSISETKPLFDDTQIISDEKYEVNEKIKSISFFNFFLVIIISFVAVIVLVDTFELQLKILIPNLSNYLDSLYQTLNDINLFILDLF